MICAYQSTLSIIRNHNHNRKRHTFPFQTPLPFFTLSSQKQPSPSLVVEQTRALLDKRDTQLLGRLKDRAVVLATAGSGNVLDTGASSTEDVVDEGELTMISIIHKPRRNGDGDSRKHQTKWQHRSTAATKHHALPG